MPPQVSCNSFGNPGWQQDKEVNSLLSVVICAASKHLKILSNIYLVVEHIYASSPLVFYSINVLFAEKMQTFFYLAYTIL